MSTGYADDSRLTSGQRIMRRWHIDTPLFFSLLALAFIGLFVLYSAGGENLDLILRQVMRMMLAFSVMFAIAQVNPATIRFWSTWLFGVGLILLVAVLLVGEIGKGAQRWLDLGIVTFQPSEILKLGVPMMVAWYISEDHLPPSLFRIVVTLLLIAIPAFLVIKQPDLGTALLIISSGIFALFLAGLRWWMILTTLTAIAAAAPFIWGTLHDYQRQRILTFLNPENDPLGSGYHIIQSTIAIGSGGVFGKGWLNGTQSRLDFLPERSTDFIFAVFSEEFGFIGAILLLAVYLTIIGRCLVISAQAQDTYTRILAGSLTLTFFVYFFVNIGMVSGLLPVVGVPLPLVSFGGTSMVTLLAGFGILMSIHTHRKLVGA